MERNPFGAHNAETSSTTKNEDSEKTTKKSDKKAEVFQFANRARNREEPTKESSRLFAVVPITEKVAAPKPEAEARDNSEKHEAATNEEKLSDEEVAHAEQEIARSHLQNAETTDDATANEAEASGDFLQRVADGQPVDEAFHDAAQEAGLSDAEIADLASESVETELQPDMPESNHEAPIEGDIEDNSEGFVDLGDQPREDASVSLSPGPHTPFARASSGGAGTPPSPTPSVFGAAAAGGRPAPSGAAPTVMQPQPFAAPRPQFETSQHASSPPVPERMGSRRNSAGELLVVGIVGYLIGRRRGRIKTESRLKPVQKKLEQQVRELEQNITHKEQQLARVSRSAERTPLAAVPLVERQQTRRSNERITQPGRQETRLTMQKPERAAERAGHMVLAAEAPKSAAVAKSVETSIKPQEVKTLGRAELLQMSEKVVVEGASLRKIYESGHIGERQLRHLVSEHLQGRDIRESLRKEMVEHEIDFERDPLVRDRVHTRMIAAGGGASLSALLQKAGIETTDSEHLSARRAAKAAEEAAQAAKTAHKHRTTIDVAMITMITILSVAVMVLLLR